ncbi:ABC transporter permease [Xylanibacillus composti]|uniref:ABC3 transporter permease C-terminal domain-containing protein n=1 Tax=Xylanibacillus composti TaxID=1572762 RepID=A0A8J4M2P8_9BACL|nr:ABC transporter permease [Xylanibacillus composti]MDT9726509.1 ABC transporter permease [Xylanibacillus composti]GIQ69919.1 hypothetical protein XYCOK13_27430 [Xylanibacillus composti]
MAILIMLFRKTVKNRWLVLSLLTGMTLCIALTSSMPIYKNSILQRMLHKEMEQSYVNTGAYTGRISAESSLPDVPAHEQVRDIIEMDAYWEQHIFDNSEAFTPLFYVRERLSRAIQIVPADPERVNPEQQRTARLYMRSGLLDHIRLVDGRLPSPEPVDGVYEALVTDNALVKLHMLLDNEFIVEDDSAAAPVRIKPVGVIAESDLSDLYWNIGNLSGYSNHFILDERLFEQDVMAKGTVRLSHARWYAAFDFLRFDLEQADSLIERAQRLKNVYVSQFGYFATVDLPGEKTLGSFRERESTLQALLWSLNVPLYVLIAFYLYMVSNLLIDRQKPEIAVLRSRGAGRLQLTMLYAVEGLLFTGIALAIGPFIGLMLTQALGSTDTFMSFVQRKSLQAELSPEVFIYAGGAAVGAFILNLIPVIQATRVSIVDQKRIAARQKPRSFWHLFGLDFILLVLAGYGLFSFRRRVEDLVSLGLDNKDIAVDPLLFAVPSLFILGFGLLMLRIYPMIVRLIYWIGKRMWSPSLYSSMLMVGRRSVQYQGLMLFMILTVGTGIFNASAARTMNQNMEDQIWYRQGADIVLQQRWVNDAPISSSAPGQMAQSDPTEGNYLEPPFEPFKSMPGVEMAAQVYKRTDAKLSSGNVHADTSLIGIRSDEFGQVAWMKERLLPYHFYDYLNLIAADPFAVLVSSSAEKDYNLSVGDHVSISLPSHGEMRGVIYGFIDYFPGFIPNPEAPQPGAGSRKPLLVVAQLPTIQNELALEPYEVWLKLTSPDDRQALYDHIQNENLQLLKLDDTYERIAESRNDPFRMAMNGVMSLGFILSLGISFIGFLIYWLLSLQGRMLQLGILRAMGISFTQLVGMLAAEQLLTSGAGILVGFAAGMLASHIFVPMFQLAFDPGRIVPPFEVMIQANDTVQMLLLTTTMLLTALGILIWLLSRMKIAQAVKLGED